jgi:hypothetical protein
MHMGKKHVQGTTMQCNVADRQRDFGVRVVASLEFRTAKKKGQEKTTIKE